MPSATPVRMFLERCKLGFTPSQKCLLLVIGFLYVVCPLDFDFIPLLGWLDDAYVLHLMWRVWQSPTVSKGPPGGGAVAGASSGIVAGEAVSA